METKQKKVYMNVPVLDLQKKYDGRAFNMQINNTGDQPVRVRLFGNGQTFAEVVDVDEEGGSGGEERCVRVYDELPYIAPGTSAANLPDGLKPGDVALAKTGESGESVGPYMVVQDEWDGTCSWESVGVIKIGDYVNLQELKQTGQLIPGKVYEVTYRFTTTNELLNQTDSTMTLYGIAKTRRAMFPTYCTYYGDIVTLSDDWTDNRWINPTAPVNFGGLIVRYQDRFGNDISFDPYIKIYNRHLFDDDSGLMMYPTHMKNVVIERGFSWIVDLEHEQYIIFNGDGGTNIHEYENIRIGAGCGNIEIYANWGKNIVIMPGVNGLRLFYSPGESGEGQRAYDIFNVVVTPGDYKEGIRLGTPAVGAAGYTKFVGLSTNGDIVVKNIFD